MIRMSGASDESHAQKETQAKAAEFTDAEREVLDFLRNSKRVDLRWLSEEQKRNLRTVLGRAAQREEDLALSHLEGGREVVHGDMGALQGA